MEYAEAGPVMRGDRSTEKVPLAEGVALKFFRDVLQVNRLYSCMTEIVLGFWHVQFPTQPPYWWHVEFPTQPPFWCRHKAHTWCMSAACTLFGEHLK